MRKVDIQYEQVDIATARPRGQSKCTTQCHNVMMTIIMVSDFFLHTSNIDRKYFTADYPWNCPAIYKVQI